MKNFKKSIFLVLIGLLVVGIFIYKNLNNNQYDGIELNDYNILEVEGEGVEGEKEESESSYIIVHIAGEVTNPGIMKVKKDSRVADVIEMAGGLTKSANIEKVNLAFIVSDGQKIYIPSIYDNEESGYVTTENGEGIIDNSFSIKANAEKININTATQTELEQLTGIGPSTALKIINYRNENGKFKTIEELKNVPGIGENKFQSIKDNICV